MEQRIVDFIAALRSSGVRVSLAESTDAFRAINHIGVIERSEFKSALHATLVKDAKDTPTFEALFPIFFGSGGPPPVHPPPGPPPPEAQRPVGAPPPPAPPRRCSTRPAT